MKLVSCEGSLNKQRAIEARETGVEGEEKEEEGGQSGRRRRGYRRVEASDTREYLCLVVEQS